MGRKLSPKIERKVVGEYLAGIGSTTLGRKYGCSAFLVLNLVRRAGHKVRTQRAAAALVDRVGAYEPTPEEIAQTTAIIQQGWSEMQERHRAGRGEAGVTPQSYTLTRQGRRGRSAINVEG